MSRRILLYLSAIFLALHIALTVLALAIPGQAAMSGRLQLPAMFFFSLGHATYALGWRRTAVFLALSAGISWIFEQVGVATGLVYGAYHYGDMLGPKLGHVPIMIPIAWFMMLYPSYIIANLVASGRFDPRPRALAPIVWLAFLGAMVMTAWDLVMDPVFSGLGMWTWENGGAYFGVPIHNFGGWLLTTFAIYLAFRLWDGRAQWPAGAPATRLVAIMPLLAYASVMVRMFTEPALGLIAFFAMGLPLFIALGRLFDSSVSPKSD